MLYLVVGWSLFLPARRSPSPPADHFSSKRQLSARPSSEFPTLLACFTCIFMPRAVVLSLPEEEEEEEEGMIFVEGGRCGVEKHERKRK